MIKRILLASAIMIVASIAFAEVNAVFREVSGKVEVQEGKKGWVAAKAGMAVTKGATISTGFKAKATVALGESIVIVKQLTRMRLDELIEKEGTISTELYLDVGKITAEVKTEGKLKNDFRLRSPVVTAAVRGTIIDFSTDTVDLIQGMAVSYNSIRQKTSIIEGDSVEYRTPLISKPVIRPKREITKIRRIEVSPDTKMLGGATKGITVRGMSTVLISLEW